MTTGSVSQGGLIVVGETAPPARVSQGGLLSVVALTPGTLVSQGGLIVVADSSSCTTRRCQLWEIWRQDGVVMRFTSRDKDVIFGDYTYQACASLNETASEQSSDQGDVGNIELSGILDSEAISDEDIYAGLYDDAFVQVWRVSWDDPTDKIFRVAAGWFGAVSQAENGFKVEVLGPGARLLQKALLPTVAPTCRWRFGDPDTCQFDREALAIPGVVTIGSARSFFYASITNPGGVAQWSRGKVRWLYGRNAGLEHEVREVDFNTGLIILAMPTGFKPEVGEDFELLPGCDLSFAQCQAYENEVNHGGYPDVPGADAYSVTPDAKA